MENTVSARIDLSALRHNLGIVRARCPRSRILAVVKADAYGHGLVPVARALSAADALAVARLQEALALRQAGIRQRLVVLATLLDEADLRICSSEHIDVTVHDEHSVAALTKHSGTFRVWLKLDSGMHRAGLNPRAFLAADRALAHHAAVVELTHMTHFSDAVNPTSVERQMSCFQRCHQVGSKTCGTSVANSAALLSRSDLHGDWVRPGIMLYGENPLGPRVDVPLRTAMTLVARIVALREIGAGESVGYSAGWRSIRPSRIATVGIGYGDGYPRQAVTGTPVWVGGRVVPLVGYVSMDSLAIDVTGCEGIEIGHEVQLWGSDLPVSTVAACANTIPYDLFTSLTSRVPRVYAT